MKVRNTVWLYLIIFTALMLLLFWVAFLSSFEANYKNAKIRDTKKAADYILNIENDENFTADMLNKLAYENNMCILILDQTGRLVYRFDAMGESCVLHSLNYLELYLCRAEAAASPDGLFHARPLNRFGKETLLLAYILGERESPAGYVYLNVLLEPLDSEAALVKNQIFFILAMLFALGVCVSLFIARRIERPVKRVARCAKKLSQGESNLDFNGQGYAETELIADALRFAAAEISKVGGLRRDIVANISHDLRTPLTMVKAYAEMLRDISGGNPQKRDEHIGIIIDESDRLASLVKDILDLSALESGVVGLNITEFDITEKISGIMERYKIFSERQGYKFILSLGNPFTVSADTIKIEQVLYNLINNAVNYTGENKTVYIVQRNSKNHTLIEITDTGAGIEKELLPLIFDRYYRAEKSKRDVIGTGLGLSIVKQILKQHNCRFGVSSIMGVGSTFWFEISGGEAVNNEQ